MKKASAFVASVAAASSMALHPGSASSSSSSDAGRSLCQASFGQEFVEVVSADRLIVDSGTIQEILEFYSSCGKQSAEQACGGVSQDEKFAPRFDGLRFIETLITAHR
ncbi:uncharacterized protein LOC144712510 [Wolffia australiana]